ncbi:Zn(II)2Cys6 transcription factor [Aspergillus brunneoviolaceus CBS 621.78]|uniref:Uncharacterized protein n=1 Tax=Aspergillus brunneoviolaceus CBS 621.78 TaxID=1450534 RepID=A0ACD1GLE7_9EURO|nr:hypothetical protein BO95DRAFT_478962 [Aspergillus brunneoviolaceus CBS 621.78]RAH50096.1 hypothetical protein BO95DRAFT_478962 [Aspergillus brunneoviolaceus CBS 621.78]
MDSGPFKDSLTSSHKNLVWRRASKPRSRTGCRTCRARRIKCDEAPGSCQRCTSTGRVCDGYEVQRLPLPPRRKTATVSRIPAPVPTGFRFTTTTDEIRCFSYFQHCSVSHLIASVDNPLWEKLVLQMSYNEPAVYHAIVALGSIHQNLEKHGLPRPGKKSDSTLERFAMEQSLRSFSMLTQRRASQDPALRQVVLICCLLFTVTELLCARPETASVHLAGGLRILRELRAQRCAHSPWEQQTTLETYLHLQSQSFFMMGGPILTSDHEIIHEMPYEDHLSTFTTFHEAQRAFGPVFNASCGFHVIFWKQRQKIPAAESYQASLLSPTRILSCLNRFLQQLEAFVAQPSTRLGTKERRGVQLLRVITHGQIVGVKSSLLLSNDLSLHSLMEDFVNLHRMLKTTLDQIRDRPLISLGVGLTPVFFFLAQCPDYEIRLWAIDSLLSWPHCGGFFNSKQMAQVVLQGMKTELRTLRESCPLRVDGVVGFFNKEDGSSFARILYSGENGATERLVRLDE